MKNIVLPAKSSVASFDVDCQNTFTPLCPDELPTPNGTDIVAQLNKQAQLASCRVGSKDAHSREAIWVATDDKPQFSPISGDNVDVHWAVHAIPGTLGFELIDGLPKVTDYDYFVWKGIELDMHPYGACYHDFAEKLSTGVIEFLKSQSISTVLVGGLATDYCVKTTALQLVRADFTVIVNLGACRPIQADTEAAAIETLRDAGVQFVTSTQDLVTQP